VIIIAMYMRRDPMPAENFHIHSKGTFCKS